jgi:hypothetical protein
MKTFSQLQRDIATEMWQIWCPIKPMPKVPVEFYEMAKVAIKATNVEFDSMVAEAIKAKLEKLVKEDANIE